MEFLPLEIDGQKVYAGFWKRFWAGLIDSLVLIPFVYIFFLIEGVSMPIAMLTTVISTILFSAYSIFFNYKYGGTIGKLAVDIRITRPDGSPISIKEAFLRSSVDLVFAFFAIAAQIMALSMVDPEQYTSASFFDRNMLMVSLFPVWYIYLTNSSNAWYWSELIVLLFNKRRRALHDFIAGTIVIHKQYAQQIATFRA